MLAQTILARATRAHICDDSFSDVPPDSADHDLVSGRIVWLRTVAGKTSQSLRLQAGEVRCLERATGRTSFPALIARGTYGVLLLSHGHRPEAMVEFAHVLPLLLSRHRCPEIFPIGMSAVLALAIGSNFTEAIDILNRIDSSLRGQRKLEIEDPELHVRIAIAAAMVNILADNGDAAESVVCEAWDTALTTLGPMHRETQALLDAFDVTCAFNERSEDALLVRRNSTIPARAARVRQVS